MKISIEVDEEKKLFWVRVDGLSSIYGGAVATFRSSYNSVPGDRAEELAPVIKDITWMITAHFLAECHSKRV